MPDLKSKRMSDRPKTDLDKRFMDCVYGLIDRGHGKNIARIAERVGIVPETIYMVRSGRVSVGIETLNKLMDSYPQVNSDYLLQGRGEMFLAQITRQPGIPFGVAQEPEPVKAEKGVEVEIELKHKDAILAAKDREIELLEREINLLKQIISITDSQLIR